MVVILLIVTPCLHRGHSPLLPQSPPPSEFHGQASTADVQPSSAAMSHFNTLLSVMTTPIPKSTVYAAAPMLSRGTAGGGPPGVGLQGAGWCPLQTRPLLSCASWRRCWTPARTACGCEEDQGWALGPVAELGRRRVGGRGARGGVE